MSPSRDPNRRFPSDAQRQAGNRQHPGEAQPGAGRTSSREKKTTKPSSKRGAPASRKSSGKKSERQKGKSKAEQKNQGKPPLRLNRRRRHAPPGGPPPAHIGKETQSVRILVILIILAVFTGPLVFDRISPYTPSLFVLTEPEEQMRTVWFCPDVPVGEGVESTLSILSLEDEPVDVTLRFFPDTGDEIVAPTITTLYGDDLDLDIGDQENENLGKEDTGKEDTGQNGDLGVLTDSQGSEQDKEKKDTVSPTDEDDLGDLGTFDDDFSDDPGLRAGTRGAEVEESPQEPTKISVPGHTRERVRVADYMQESGALTATVPRENVAVALQVLNTSAGEEEIQGVSSAPCAKETQDTWYLASGSTLRTYRYQVQIFNPTGEDAIVSVEYVFRPIEQTEARIERPDTTSSIPIPAGTRRIVNVDDVILRASQVVAIVHADPGNVVVSQTVRISKQKGIGRDLGISSPAEHVFLPEVRIGDGADAIGVYNPSDQGIDVQINFHPLVGNETVTPNIIPLEAHDEIVLDFDLLAEEVTGVYGIELLSDWPVAVGQWRRATEGVSLAKPLDGTGKSWWLSGFRPDFKGHITVQNPGEKTAEIHFYPVGDGSGETRSAKLEALPFTAHVPPYSVQIVPLEALGLQDPSFSLYVVSTEEVAVGEVLVEAEDIGFSFGTRLFGS